MTVTNLEREDAGLQLELPLDGRSHRDLDAAVDDVRDRFGAQALRRAVALGRDDRGPPQIDG